VCRQLSISEQTYYRWRKQYGGLKISQVKRIKDIERENTRLKKARIKDIERENTRLKKAVADLTLDKVILKEALEGNY
jgi:transposase-like protein